MSNDTQTLTAPRWEYEAEYHEDMGGADVYHHVVAGDRHVCEVETESDARLIVESVNRVLLAPDVAP